MYQERYYQREAHDAIFYYYAKGSCGNPVVVMPTASGKSWVIGLFIRTVMQRWPRQRVLVVTHVKELIEQNAEKLKLLWPEAPMGIFSAGLGQRDTHFPIIYGGVASMVNCIDKFGWRDLMLVDEAHLISPKDGTQYQEIIAKLRLVNPNMKVIGFTATPFRMGSGMISDGPIFTDVCYDLSAYDAFNRLVNEGYLCKLIPKKTHTELDVSQVKITDGDFNKDQLQAAVDKDHLTVNACNEIIDLGFDRDAWLIFASGIEHANHIAEYLQSCGIESASVHSKMPQSEADQNITDFKAGKLRAIVNYGKLTTGFDYPAIDLIGMLRPTTSTVLWVQMLGRGLRVCEGKENCLVPDFAGNTPRLGPINDPMIPRKRGKGAPGAPPVRICPECGMYNHARSTECGSCGYVFPTSLKIQATANTDALIRVDEPPVVVAYNVNRVVYSRKQKNGHPPMIRVQYFCGLQMFSEYICLEHHGYAGKKARDWWQVRAGTSSAPPTVDAALNYIKMLREPKMIKVWQNRKYPEVLGYEY
jgi:DNA repair protein RadD